MQRTSDYRLPGCSPLTEPLVATRNSSPVGASIKSDMPTEYTYSVLHYLNLISSDDSPYLHKQGRKFGSIQVLRQY